MNVKTFYLCILVLIFGTFFSWCGKTTTQKGIENLIEKRMEEREDGTEKNTLSPDKKNIAFIGKSQTDSLIGAISQSARNEISINGYNFVEKNPANQSQIVDEQIRILQELIDSKVDGIMIVPGGTKLYPTLKKAQDANIPIVIVNSDIDKKEAENQGLKPIASVRIDNLDSEYKVTKTVANNINKSTNALVIVGDLTSITAQQRREGALKALKENENINIVAVEDGSWKRNNGYNIAKKQFSTFPDIQLVVCGNDEMALGVIQYLQEINKTDVAVVGFDATNDGLNAIKQGKMNFTVKQNADIIGQTSAKTILDLLNGRSVLDFTKIDTEIIDKNNSSN